MRKIVLAISALALAFAMSIAPQAQAEVLPCVHTDDCDGDGVLWMDDSDDTDSCLLTDPAFPELDEFLDCSTGAGNGLPDHG
jgi:hypothetical protein